MELRIIRLKLSHLQACIDLDQKALKGLWTKSQWEIELTDPKRICSGVIELQSKKLLGLICAWLIIDELYITSIAVHPIHQRKGLGKFLMKDLIKRSKSLQTNFIQLEVKESNEAAKAFYKSLGFKILARRSDFYKDGSDAIIFSKQLNKNDKRYN